MQIMKIDPNEKYVLLFPEIDNEDKMQEVADNLEFFLTEEKDNLAFIYGERIAIVPASQVVGYKVVGRNDGADTT